MSSYYLSMMTHPLVSMLVASGCWNRRKDYYWKLKITNDIRDRGDHTYFVIMFLDILKGQMKDMLDTEKEYA